MVWVKAGATNGTGGWGVGVVSDRMRTSHRQNAALPASIQEILEEEKLRWVIASVYFCELTLHKRRSVRKW